MIVIQFAVDEILLTNKFDSFNCVFSFSRF